MYKSTYYDHYIVAVTINAKFYMRTITNYVNFDIRLNEWLEIVSQQSNTPIEAINFYVDSVFNVDRCVSIKARRSEGELEWEEVYFKLDLVGSGIEYDLPIVKHLMYLVDTYGYIAIDLWELNNKTKDIAFIKDLLENHQVDINLYLDKVKESFSGKEFYFDTNINKGD